MTRKAKSTKPKAKRARRQPQKKAEMPASWSYYGPAEQWHQRAPLKTGIEFSELVLASYDNGLGPLKFIFDTIVSCMDHEQLDKFHSGVWMIRGQCLDEIARRKAHKALPRVLDAS